MSLTETHKLVVSDIQKDTQDAIVVTLRIPEAIRKRFAFKHGQYLTLKKRIEGEEIRRPYSICTEASNAPEFLQVGIKRVEDGLFSSWAHRRLRVENEIEVFLPDGKFTSSLAPSEAKRYCCVAIGSGITPILSVVKTILFEEQFSKIILLYGNRRLSNVMFLEEINGLKNRYIDRFQVCHVLTREPDSSNILRGRIDGQKVLEFVRMSGASVKEMEFFVCGPSEMSEEVFSILLDVGIDPKLFHRELFGQYFSTEMGKKQSTNSHQITSTVSLKVDGRTYEVLFHAGQKNILQAALEQGIDMPYSCRAGACTTCRGMLVQGRVDSGGSSVLDEASVSAGYILTCQSWPTTKNVAIDLDQKR